MGFGGGKSSPPPKPEPVVEPEPEKPTKRQQDDSAALRARRLRPATSLLSPEREGAQQGLPRKLSGGQ